MQQGYTYHKDDQNIVTITLDMVGQPVNLMNADFDTILTEFTTRLEGETSLTGAIITSAKETFFAGGDLEELGSVENGAEDIIYKRIEALKANFRKLERLGKPVVAALNGSALGGGLELALACHGRIALNTPKAEFGLPEVTLGLLPGAGGVTRLVRMMGLEKALPYLSEGRRLRAKQAQEAGWITALADNGEEMLALARDFIHNNSGIQQPWDIKGYKIPGGTPNHPKIAQMLMVAPSMMRAKTRGLMPAPELILQCMVEGAQVDFDTACRIESRALIQLLVHPVAKNLIATFFFGLNALNAGASRPANIPKTVVNKVGILGAGMMGAGIAYAAAQAGIEVVLKDVTLAAAEKGKAYSTGLMDKAIQKGRATDAKKAALLNLILPTENITDLSDCDLIIEAVFEEESLKAQVTAETEAVLAEDVIYATNTSTLPITMLADASRDPSRYIGLHFFSPVDKMPLVEIITGAKTSPETLAAAFDFTQQIKKIPIVVNDNLGFFTSRVFGTYMDEGVQLLREGVSPVLIDNLAKLTGMPVGPLTVMDEVSQKLVNLINETNKRLIKDGLAQGTAAQRPATQNIIPKMVELGRAGRTYGGGFYDYPEKTVWAGLQDLTPLQDHQISDQDIKDRLIFRQVIESLKCLEEKVLNTVMDGNIGSVFGIGFPQHTGGVFQYVNSMGIEAFQQRARALAEKYGDRFDPPHILQDTLNARKSFT